MMKQSTFAAASRPAPIPVGPKPSVWGERSKYVAMALLPYIVLVALWQVISTTQPAYVFPPLGEIFKTIGLLHEEGVLIPATLVTIKSVLIGAVISAIVGTLIGFALARFDAFTGPILNFVQTVPYVVWALMALIWFGLTPFSVVFTIVVAAFPIVSFNVAAGLKNVDNLLLGMSQSVRASRLMVLRHIVFPSLTPYLLSASRTMLGMCWKISVLAELFAGGAGGGGVGYKLFVGWEFSRPSEVFAWTLWLVLLMLLSEWLVIKPIEAFITRWKKA
ncbi:ABC transporter permease [Herbaspirillum sp. SJZ107]|uniref:ABC transporter permease n=1 Tax=Herbaspirillum sp. SJZ107 TaxID=2572881 RepID=UPI0011670948|nr:ABC transporter permease subunit [Herbaspirillum sp. SJZ107]TQK01115.1 NitT/TauT family transport system permease protein/phthalate transport system permease protein [Herbaspirillum sp. SJZ107]